MYAASAACARPPLPAPDFPTELPADRTRHYTIWLGGARVGTATESETWSRDGVRLRRVEALRFLRGDAEVDLHTGIEIDANPALLARRVRWTEADASTMRHAEAHREHDSWQVSTGEPLPPDAVPAELVPLLVRRDGRFDGTVFLPARNFVAGRGRIDPVAPGRLVAQVTLDHGAIVEATIDVDRDGIPARIVDGDGVIAVRATEDEARAAFPAVDLISATAIPIAGAAHSRRLVLDGDLALPPLPGQRAQISAQGLEVDLGAELTGDLPAGAPGPDRKREIAAIVSAVRARITPALAVSPASSRDAAATAGDCTTFALAYAALASSRAIATRVVTGLRVDGDRLVRHRWAVSWTGTHWIAVDAAFGAVPAGGDLVGLAVHDSDDAGLVAGEAALTQVRAARWADAD